MSALLERMEQVLRDKGWSGREWSRAAGLSPSHVNLVMFRLRKGEAYMPTKRTLVALSRAAGVALVDEPSQDATDDDTARLLRAILALTPELRRALLVVVESMR